LWDLVDDEVDAGDIEEEKKYKDHFALGATGTWILLESEDIEDVSSLYEELESTLGEKDSDASDGVSDLDALFIMHGFFHDANGNGLWDEGEEVGCGVSWRGKDAEDEEDEEVPKRDDVPPIPGTALDVRVLDEDERPVAVRLFRVEVRFPGGEGDYDYETWPDPNDGTVRMHVPARSEQVLLRAVAAGYDAEPLALRPEAFWRAVEEAQARGEDVCLAPVLRVRGNGIAPPEEVRAEALDPATVRLACKAAGPVVVVRNLRHSPTLPGDGETLYEGDGSEVIDTGLFAGTTYRYAVFSAEGDRWSRPASAVVTTSTAGASAGDQETRRGLWLGLLVVIVLSAALFLWRRRRR
ncbi:MAG: hypothetical protein ACC662_07225, partial [Planctomycetota bacterium]